MSHNQDVLGRAVDVGRSIELKPLATVERFERHAGEQAEIQEAVRVLEHECMVLKAALGEHSLPAEPIVGDSR